MKIIVTIVILSSFSFGNLSKEQLVKLREVSWGIREFKSYQDKRYNYLLTVLEDKNTTNLERIKKYAYCTESLNAFLYEFSKLTNEEYSEIISFYQTDVGEKLNHAYIGFHPKMLNKIYKKSKNQIKISNKKISLILLIFKELNLINLQSYYEMDRLMIERLIDRKNPKYSDDSILKYTNNIRSVVEKNIKEYGIAFFKEFTMDELEKVLKYAQSKGGKRELDVFYRGLKEAYFNQIYICQNPNILMK